jgi:outer membrane murein-binding lipoprotein Lpp
VTTWCFICALALISSLNLSGCTDARLDKSIALCTEAMELNASQLRLDEEQKLKLIKQVCAQAGGGRTPEQWQCVITAMKQSESYVKATDTCFPR